MTEKTFGPVEGSRIFTESFSQPQLTTIKTIRINNSYKIPQTDVLTHRTAMRWEKKKIESKHLFYEIFILLKKFLRLSLPQTETHKKFILSEKKRIL